MDSFNKSDPIDRKLHQTLRQTKQSLHTKTDIRVLDFDSEQVKIFNKIRKARSSLERNFSNNENKLKMSSTTRRLKQIQMDAEKNTSIKRENARLYKKIIGIFSTPKESPKPLSRVGSKILSRSGSTATLSPSKASLNYMIRKREHSRL